MVKYTVNLLYGKATFPLKKKKNIGYKVSVTYRVCFTQCILLLFKSDGIYSSFVWKGISRNKPLF